jgi:hypothetical protein
MRGNYKVKIIKKNKDFENLNDEMNEITHDIEFTDEKEETIIYFEGFSSRHAYNKEDLNKKVKDLFESCNINFLIGSGYCYEKLKTLGDLESLIEENSVINRNNKNNKTAVDALILYHFFLNSIYPHAQDLELKYSFENSNRFIINLASYQIEMIKIYLNA